MLCMAPGDRGTQKRSSTPMCSHPRGSLVLWLAEECTGTDCTESHQRMVRTGCCCGSQESAGDIKMVCFVGYRLLTVCHRPSSCGIKLCVCCVFMCGMVWCVCVCVVCCVVCACVVNVCCVYI